MISVGELAKGMKITINQWHPRQGTEIGEGFTTKTITYTDHSWVGDVFEVIAVDLPFLACKNLSSSHYGVIQIDTRMCDLQELSKEYVDAVLSGRQ